LDQKGKKIGIPYWEKQLLRGGKKNCAEFNRKKEKILVRPEKHLPDPQMQNGFSWESVFAKGKKKEQWRNGQQGSG